jgi:NAD+ synthase
MGAALGLPVEIITAPPTDGLWDDGRTDEDQLGMTYADLEVMMQMDAAGFKPADKDLAKMQRYLDLRARNQHKMQPIPVCRFDK